MIQVILRKCNMATLLRQENDKMDIRKNTCHEVFERILTTVTTIVKYFKWEGIGHIIFKLYC